MRTNQEIGVASDSSSNVTTRSKTKQAANGITLIMPTKTSTLIPVEKKNEQKHVSILGGATAEPNVTLLLSSM